MKKSFALVLFISILFSCSNDENNKDYTAQNEAEISAYLAANNLSATRSESGLYYIVNEPGTGTQPSAASTVTVAYKGYFLNGEVFDDSEGSGVTFSLSRVIKGWTEGIAYFKEGGSGILLVPSHLGYGSSKYGPIPGGSVLIFDINLIAVE
ncbi:FKBP-type peptidyl-prolyl cis-trans isomerase [Cellulophaga tyrosinoxydans]|uniref:Peptidyl-prolyl cis-trans isomerase n=1 Tax=Cellulophaga tyrosinoxydans TaxID=504486 RepID=A0A1W1YYI5_9FLAO|nr:FKBP-type peptidyl-prolyl cis-trans isomerase [Cellulophaga tyrosinoxydans]SMC40881.1 FKBP-type peptidyl-prolyl cis-trans isomerase [Cellulophaga tyrosinoxydans]